MRFLITVDRLTESVARVLAALPGSMLNAVTEEFPGALQCTLHLGTWDSLEPDVEKALRTLKEHATVSFVAIEREGVLVPLDTEAPVRLGMTPRTHVVYQTGADGVRVYVCDNGREESRALGNAQRFSEATAHGFAARFKGFKVAAYDLVRAQEAGA